MERERDKHLISKWINERQGDLNCPGQSKLCCNFQETLRDVHLCVIKVALELQLQCKRAIKSAARLRRHDDGMIAILRIDSISWTQSVIAVIVSLLSSVDEFKCGNNQTIGLNGMNIAFHPYGTMARNLLSHEGCGHARH